MRAQLARTWQTCLWQGRTLRDAACTLLCPWCPMSGAGIRLDPAPLGGCMEQDVPPVVRKGTWVLRYRT